MPRAEVCLFGPLGWSVVARSAANAIATATKAAEADKQHIISGISISASAAPAATVIVQLLKGATVLDEWQIPTAAFAPIVFDFHRPFVGDVNQAVSLSIPALGGTTISTAVLRGITTTF